MRPGTLVLSLLACAAMVLTGCGSHFAMTDGRNGVICRETTVDIGYRGVRRDQQVYDTNPACQPPEQDKR